MPHAYFEPGTGPGEFLATAFTEGPWTAGVQHGGPPAALLTRAVEVLPSTVDGPVQVARLTFEILGPVPVGPVRVSAEVVRPGRAVELVEASLSAAGRDVIRARAWRIRTTSLTLPDAAAGGTLPDAAAGGTLPDAAAGGEAPLPALPPEPSPISKGPWRDGYLSSVEWRFVHGHFERPGPAQVWSRLRVPLLDGEKPSGLQRAVAVADSGNGLSRLLDFEGWWFINTELTVHAYRVPVGEWIFVDARTRVDASGVGLASTTLRDEQGTFGTGAQSLLIGPRPPAGPMAG